MRLFTANLLAASSLALISAQTSAVAQSAEQFYANNRVTFIVAASAGGGYNEYSRVLMRHMPKHIPGNPSVVVQNMPGAGGVKAANYMYNVAAQNGSVIGSPIASIVLGQALRPERSKYAAEKFGWVGTITTMTDVLGVFAETGVTSIDDAKKKPIIIGATGKLGTSYLQVALANALLGTKFKIVEGYKSGTETNLAMDRKEVFGRTNQWTSWRTQRPQWIESKEVAFLVQYGPQNPDLPGVPAMRDLVKDPEKRQIVEFMEMIQYVGRSVYSPPNVPADRLDTIRKAFDATMKDPALLAEMKKRNLAVYQSRTGAELQADLARILPNGEALATRMKALLKIK